MPKKRLHIAYNTQSAAEAAMDLLERNTSDWYSRIETAQISPTYSEDLPDMEDFEDATSDWNHDTDSAYTGGGTQSNPYLLYRDSGTSPSGGTGPGSNSSYYAYTEASGNGAPNKYFAMERNIIGGTGASKMRFYYHMHGNSMDFQNASHANEKAYMSVEVSINDGATWTPLPITKDLGGSNEAIVARLDGEQQEESTLPFLQAEVDISSVGNNSFKIRFFAKTSDRDPANNTSQSFTSDMAIDDITFHRNPPETKYLVQTDGKGYETLFNSYLQEGKNSFLLYENLKQVFIAREYKIDDEEKAINGWTSTWYEYEEKMSLRKATKEYLNKRVEEAGNQTKSSDYQLKRQEYLDLGGSQLPDE